MNKKNIKIMKIQGDSTMNKKNINITEELNILTLFLRVGETNHNLKVVCEYIEEFVPESIVFESIKLGDAIVEHMTDDGKQNYIKENLPILNFYIRYNENDDEFLLNVNCSNYVLTEFFSVIMDILNKLSGFPISNE